MFVILSNIYFLFYQTENCYFFEISSISGSTYQSAKDHCINQGGEIVSNLLGSDGVKYHRFASILI